MTSAAADVDGHLAPRRRRHHRQAPMLAVIAVGGAVGACTRYGLTLWLPHRAGAFPWSTFATNVSGCLLIGVLMVLVSEAWSAHRLVRPFLGTGVLGGYTTFSTYTVETRALLAGGHAGLGLLYLGATLVCALTAVYAGVLLSRWVTASRRPTDRRRR
jgi:CrcB protein